MSKRLFELLMFPVLFVVLIIDGQLSTLATNWSVGNFSISSHILLMIAIFYANFISLKFSLFVFMIIGFIYDISYLGLVGIATTTLPLVVFGMYFFFQAMESRRIFNLLILVVSLFQFEFISYLFARFFHLTNLSVFIFVFNNLLPSLLFNLVLFFILQPLMEQSFGFTNKT
ncbi:rod shape-determining protein MreD [Streptococcus suis]|nr:rod shape-determining protein MreD [Streptococcus suis]